jgi:hypothetical protein
MHLIIYQERRAVLLIDQTSMNTETHLDLQLEELDVADGLLEHGDQVDLGAVGHQLLQRPQPLADPLAPSLHTCKAAQITGKNM